MVSNGETVRKGPVMMRQHVGWVVSDGEIIRSGMEAGVPLAMMQVSEHARMDHTITRIESVHARTHAHARMDHTTPHLIRPLYTSPHLTMHLTTPPQGRSGATSMRGGA